MESGVGSRGTARDQAGCARQGGQQSVDLRSRQHGRQAPALRGAADLRQPGRISVRHLAIQEQQRAERLPVRGDGHAALRRSRTASSSRVERSGGRVAQETAGLRMTDNAVNVYSI